MLIEGLGWFLFFFLSLCVRLQAAINKLREKMDIDFSRWIIIFKIG